MFKTIIRLPLFTVYLDESPMHDNTKHRGEGVSEIDRSTNLNIAKNTRMETQEAIINNKYQCEKCLISFLNFWVVLKFKNIIDY